MLVEKLRGSKGYVIVEVSRRGNPIAVAAADKSQISKTTDEYPFPLFRKIYNLNGGAEANDGYTYLILVVSLQEAHKLKKRFDGIPDYSSDRSKRIILPVRNFIEMMEYLGYTVN